MKVDLQHEESLLCMCITDNFVQFIKQLILRNHCNTNSSETKNLIFSHEQNKFLETLQFPKSNNCVPTS